MKLVTLFLHQGKKITFDKQTILLLIGVCGGFFLSKFPLPVGWMIGAMLFTGLFSLWNPEWAQTVVSEKGVHPIWRQLGQLILAIQLGRHITPGVYRILQASGISISCILLLSMFLSTLSGALLWRFSKSDLLTCLYGTTPGGISAMPTISAEVGANSVVVTFIQMIRNILVVSLIPLLTMYWNETSFSLHQEKQPAALYYTYHPDSPAWVCYVWTSLLVFGAYGGYRFWKRLKLPAAPLAGGMTGASFLQFAGEWWYGGPLTPWWPDWLMTIAQIFLGVSIGSRMNRRMFLGMNRILIVGTVTSAIYICIMILCSVVFAHFMGISPITSMLAFAPGGVAEMALTATLVGANAPFVAAVQTIRLFLVLLALPPLFRLVQTRAKREGNERYPAS